jgi:hypothetical protein
MIYGVEQENLIESLRGQGQQANKLNSLLMRLMLGASGVLYATMSVGRPYLLKCTQTSLISRHGRSRSYLPARAVHYNTTLTAVGPLFHPSAYGSSPQSRTAPHTFAFHNP